MFDIFGYIILLLIIGIMFKNMLSFRTDVERAVHKIDTRQDHALKELNDIRQLLKGNRHIYTQNELAEQLGTFPLNTRFIIYNGNLLPDQVKPDMPELAPGRESQDIAPKSPVSPEPLYRQSITEILHEQDGATFEDVFGEPDPYAFRQQITEELNTQDGN